MDGQDGTDVEDAATCGSCGRDGEDLTPVHRIYVRTGDDGAQVIDEQDELEAWCASCRATYPHATA